MTSRKPYTPNDLRKLAKQRGPQWDGEVRAALAFCADLIAAADAMNSDHEAALAAAVHAAEVATWAKAGAQHNVALAEAVRKEREACAVLLENGHFLHDQSPAKLLANEAAKAIRARSDKP